MRASTAILEASSRTLRPSAVPERKARCLWTRTRPAPEGSDDRPLQWPSQLELRSRKSPEPQVRRAMKMLKEVIDLRHTDLARAIPRRANFRYHGHDSRWKPWEITFNRRGHVRSHKSHWDGDQPTAQSSQTTNVCPLNNGVKYGEGNVVAGDWIRSFQSFIFRIPNFSRKQPRLLSR
jgi:hypothetical protein